MEAVRCGLDRGCGWRTFAITPDDPILAEDEMSSARDECVVYSVAVSGTRGRHRSPGPADRAKAFDPLSDT